MNIFLAECIYIRARVVILSIKTLHQEQCQQSLCPYHPDKTNTIHYATIKNVNAMTQKTIIKRISEDTIIHCN